MIAQRPGDSARFHARERYSEAPSPALRRQRPFSSNSQLPFRGREAAALASKREARTYARGVSESLVEVGLSREERELLIRGLGEWGGPTRPTNALAPAMGFQDVDDLLIGAQRI